MRFVVSSILLFFTVSACAIDDEKPSTDNDLIAQNAESLESSNTAVTPASGCSVVVSCDDRSSAIGTVCRQTGCTIDQAKAECIREAKQMCGPIVCPVRLLLPSGGASIWCPQQPL